MKSTTPEGAEILSLRRSLRLALDDSEKLLRCFIVEQNALTASRARILGKYRAARVEIDMLQARVSDLEGLQAASAVHLENANAARKDLRVADVRIAGLRAELDEARAANIDLGAALLENEKLRAKVAELSALLIVDRPVVPYSHPESAADITWGLKPSSTSQDSRPTSQQASAGPS